VKRAIIAIGISGSGKTTEIAKREYDYFVRIERDIMRKRLLGFDDDNSSDNFWSLWKFTKENENKVTEMVNEIIDDCAKMKANIIIGDTNLNIKYRSLLHTKLEELGYTVEFKVFHIDVMEAIKRDERRRDTVGHQVIWKQYEQFTKEFPSTRQYVADVTKPRAILVDVDGTLAHMNGKRGAFEWDKVGLDDCDEQVKFLVNNMPVEDTVIILSGRDGICRPETEKWLDYNDIFFDTLLMRATGDMRKDTVVKEEIFWRDIAPNYNCQFVIDDRPSVCDNWRAMGLKVFQVGNPNIRF